MPTNSAAWMLGPKQRLQVREAPYPKPGPGEVVVRNRAVAINPIDWILQTQGTAMAFGWIKYPFVFGNDVAGEVVHVGEQVARLKIGDRVTGQAHSVEKSFNNSAYGGFQQYTILLERNTTTIPKTMSFESATVLPLAFATAAAGLFEKDQLNLEYPQLDANPTGKTLLVWGGSTSVGLSAIQLAVAAGYEVISTASPRNFDLLKSLGANEVYNYNDPKVVDDVVTAMKGKTSAGALAIGENSMFRCLDVLSRCKGDKHMAMATYPVPSQPKRFAMLQTIYYFVTSMISITVKSKLRRIATSFVWGSVAHSPVGEAVYANFLPAALTNGKFRAAPEPVVAGEGLEAIQGAIELQKKGVSARKVVVRLN
ncbi:GroES-like protein [Karstenula rhodostoma CBS 690.94]|uniref:GroES-like protein n=1 Tax=Karstenula rhodostoma CBS 690.94 TaxID=1392251 RepID=A0A9P4PGY0_9PLEO|nr:GroES-like protein [Karstenula rhodostoma CBS 690.94]